MQSLLLLVSALSTVLVCPYRAGADAHEDDYDFVGSEAVGGEYGVADGVHSEAAIEPGFKRSTRPSLDHSSEDVHELFISVDMNQDGLITHEELRAWLLSGLAKHNNDEAVAKMNDDDGNRDGMLSWPEVAKSALGHTQLGLNFSNDTVDREHVLILEDVLNADRLRFVAADINGDGQLNVTEYAAFIHPYDYSHMASYEIDRALADLDYNHDEAIDEAELFRNAPTADIEGVKTEKDNFDLSDLDRDGRLTGEELLHWVSHDLDTIALEETDNLFEVTDANQDDALTEDEVAAQYEQWIGGDHAEQHRRVAVKDEL